MSLYIEETKTMGTRYRQDLKLTLNRIEIELTSDITLNLKVNS